MIPEIWKTQSMMDLCRNCMICKNNQMNWTEIHWSYAVTDHFSSIFGECSGRCSSPKRCCSPSVSSCARSLSCRIFFAPHHLILFYLFLMFGTRLDKEIDAVGLGLIQKNWPGLFPDGHVKLLQVELGESFLRHWRRPWIWIQHDVLGMAYFGLLLLLQCAINFLFKRLGQSSRCCASWWMKARSSSHILVNSCRNSLHLGAEKISQRLSQAELSFANAEDGGF